MQADRKKISFVIPMFNEQHNVEPIVNAVKKHVPSTYEYEFVLVDDGSNDATSHEIERLGDSDSSVKGVLFYKNFGHQAALLAGLNEASGDAVITMDADFQHPPKLIKTLLEKWEKGHDLVICKKAGDSEPRFYIKIFRILGYKLYSVLSKNHLIPGVSDFRLMDKKIVSYLRSCTEYRFVLRGLVLVPARNVAIVPYKVGERLHGKSSYTIRKLLKLFTNSVISFSFVPLRIASLLGMFFILLAMLYLVYILYLRFIVQVHIIEGWTTLMFIVIFLFGIVFFYLGLLGEYVGAMFEEVKARPKYYIDRKINI